MVRRFFTIFFIGFVLLAAILLIQTFRFRPQELSFPRADPLQFNEQQAIERLSGAIRIETVSHQDQGKMNAAEFEKFQQHLHASFPLIHSTISRTVIGHSLLYEWKGTDSSLKPVLLLAHMDVVPVLPGTEGQWKYPPFSGVVVEEAVWGRGSMDDKGSLISLLQAIELLLQEKHRPRRTVFLAFGHDEEVGGKNGAAEVARFLESRDLSFEFVLDEGMVITDGLMPGVSRPVAMIGTAEKGYLNLELVVRGEGGHSSMPPVRTPVGILGEALSRIEQNPFPAHLTGDASELFDRVGPYMPFLPRMLFANRWLFAPVLAKILRKSPTGNAFVSTTAAPTMLTGSTKENVLPVEAKAVINFRVHPEETFDSVIRHVKRAVDEERVVVRVKSGPSAKPSEISPTNVPMFGLIQRSILQIIPDVIIAPALVLGGTDSRHYSKLSGNIYRFVPLRATEENLSTVHGTNERVAIKDYFNCIRFYHQLLLNIS